MFLLLFESWIVPFNAFGVHFLHIVSMYSIASSHNDPELNQLNLLDRDIIIISLIISYINATCNNFKEFTELQFIRKSVNLNK